MFGFIIAAAIAYALGSVSSAIIICKLLNLPDPRTEGSGNPGATNVLRVGGKKAALFTLGADILKGAIALIIARAFGVSGFFLGITAIAVVAGHIFPFLYNFKGGKGGATALGALIIMSPLVGLMTAAIWVLVAALMHYASLATMISAAFAVVIGTLFTHSGYFLPLLGLAGLLIWRHKENIQRLRDGSEPKFDFSKNN